MKLHYYDEVTPADYEPPMFRPGSMEDAMFYFSGDPTKIKFGQVNSGHHCIDVKMHSVLDDDAVDDDNEPDIKDQESRMQKSSRNRPHSSETVEPKITRSRSKSIQQAPSEEQELIISSSMDDSKVVPVTKEPETIDLIEDEVQMAGGDSTVILEEIDCPCEDPETDLGMAS
jgi:uncharacterized protein YyaL (SSP411 family)